MRQLLFDAGQLQTVIIVAACVLLALAVVYGLIKKFSRMSWLGWQTALLFAATFLVSFLPADNGVLAFCLAAGGLLGATAVLFLVGALLRKPFLALEQGGVGGRVFNRLLGALTSVFNLGVFVAVFGGLALAAMQSLGLQELDVIYTNPVWADFFGPRVLDLFFVFVFAGILRWGYRTGFLRMIVTLTVLALMLFAVFLAMYMTLQVPFLTQFASYIAGSIPMNEIAAGWIGFGIVSFIVAFVFMLVVILIAFLLNLLLRAVGKVHALVVFDGVLFALITCVVLFVCVISFNFGVSYLASGALTQSLPENMQGSMQAVETAMQAAEAFLTSSPLANIFYTFNPLRLFFS